MTRSSVVLVVDHDPRVRAALAGLLQATDEMAVATASSDEARSVAWIPPRDVAVAIVDIPDLSADALALVGRVADRVPVVAVSMQASLRLPALRAGAAAFVEKSGDATAILDAIAVALASRGEDPTP